MCSAQTFALRLRGLEMSRVVPGTSRIRLERSSRKSLKISSSPQFTKETSRNVLIFLLPKTLFLFSRSTS